MTLSNFIADNTTLAVNVTLKTLSNICTHSVPCDDTTYRVLTECINYTIKCGPGVLSEDLSLPILTVGVGAAAVAASGGLLYYYCLKKHSPLPENIEPPPIGIDDGGIINHARKRGPYLKELDYLGEEHGIWGRWYDKKYSHSKKFLPILSPK